MMGYETRLIFVHGNKPVGYQQNLAELDLCKVAYNHFGELIDICRIRQKVPKRVRKMLDKLNEIKNKIGDLSELAFWVGEEIDADDLKEKLQKQQFDLELKLEKHLPFLYGLDGDETFFDDQYGDVLLIASLDEVKQAIIKDQAKSIVEEGFNYRRFDVALRMIEGFERKPDFEGIKVVLFGH